MASLVASSRWQDPDTSTVELLMCFVRLVMGVRHERRMRADWGGRREIGMAKAGGGMADAAKGINYKLRASAEKGVVSMKRQMLPSSMPNGRMLG